MADGKITAFYGSGTSLNGLSGAVLVQEGANHGVTIAATGNTVRLQTAQDIRVSAGPIWSGVTSRHTLLAQTSGAENFGIAAMIEQPVSDVDGPRLAYHRTLASGDKFWSAGFQHGLDNLNYGVYEDNDPDITLGGYGTLRLSVENKGAGTPDPVSINAIGGVSIGSLTHDGQPLLVRSHGAFDNSHDYTAVTALIGSGATSSQAAYDRFTGVFGPLHRESAISAVSISSATSSNIENNAITAIAIATNPASTGGGTVAGSFFATATATGAQIWAFNTQVRDYDNNDPTTAKAISIIGAEMDMQIGHVDSYASMLHGHIEWKTPGTIKPNTSTFGISLDAISDIPGLDGWFDFGYKSHPRASKVGVCLGTHPTAIDYNSQELQFISGNSDQYTANVQGTSTGGLRLWPNVGSNTNKLTMSSVGDVTIDAGLTVTGPFSFNVNVNRIRSSVVRTINRSASTKFAEATSIADFGVTGSTSGSPVDEATAVQEAFNTMAVNGGWLRIPAGMSIYLGSTINVPSNLKVVGQGKGLCGFLPYALLSSGIFNLPANTTNVHMEGFFIDGRTGDNLSGSLQATARISYSSYSDPADFIWTNYSTFFINHGCSNLWFEDLRIQHTGGYAFYGLAAFSGNITDLYIRNCEFLNNRPHVAGPGGVGDYGTWGGGVQLEFNGTDAFYQRVYVQNNVWKRCTGNCWWTHAQSLSNPAYFSRDVYFTHNYGEDIGLDFAQPAGIDGYIETDNEVQRFGYVVLDDAGSTRAAKWNVIPVAFDTAGLVFNAVRSNNEAMGNGQMFDFDGCGLTTCSNNVFISSFVSSDPLVGSTGSMGPVGLLGQNWTKFVVCNNSNSIANVGAHMIFTGNETYGAGGGAFLLYGAQHSRITGNLVHHSQPYQSAPIILGNLSSFHALDNDVTSNSVHCVAGASSGPAVTEDPNGFAFIATDINRVRDNYFTPTVFFQFLKNNLSSSSTDLITISSTSSQATAIVETRLITQGTSSANHQFQLWSNYGSGSLSNTQLMTVTATATYVPALGLQAGSIGVIDSVGNFTGNSLTISNTGTPVGSGPSILLKATYPFGGGSCFIDAYTAAAPAFGQTVPNGRYAILDSPGFSSMHVFYTAVGPSVNSSLVERFRIRGNGDVNMNGNFQINGTTVINSSGSWVGGISAAILNATSALQINGSNVYDSARNAYAASYSIGPYGGSTVVINNSQQATFSALTVNSGGATFNSPASFNYTAGLFSLSASTLNATTFYGNGAQIIDSSRNLSNIGNISMSGAITTSGNINTNAGRFVCQGNLGGTNTYQVTTPSGTRTVTCVGGLFISIV